MKKSTLIIALMLSASMAMAALITDDFNRGDTAYSTDESNHIGANWVAGAADAQSAIKGNTLAYNPVTVANNVFYNTGLAQTAGTGADADSWTMSLDVTLKGAGTYGGVAFNIQDANNYYALRVKAGDNQFQMVRVLNGTSLSAFVNQADGLSQIFAAGSAYTFTVSSDTANQFTFTITEAGSSTVLNNQTFTSQGNGSWDGGYGGIYYNHALGSQLPDVVADNFSVNVIPEPATFGLLGMSALGIFAARKFRVV